MLTLQPYRQPTLTIKRCLELALKRDQPFKIKKKVGNVAYKLVLLPGTTIQIVFHVSMLKKYEGNSPQVLSTAYH